MVIDLNKIIRRKRWQERKSLLLVLFLTFFPEKMEDAKVIKFKKRKA